MFDPTLTEEQEQLVQTARRFAAERLIPNATEWDRKEEFPTKMFEEAWQLGLMNVELPEAYGGIGLHTFDGCLTSEELAYGCAGIATSNPAHGPAAPTSKRRMYSDSKSVYAAGTTPSSAVSASVTS